MKLDSIFRASVVREVLKGNNHCSLDRVFSTIKAYIHREKAFQNNANLTSVLHIYSSIVS